MSQANPSRTDRHERFHLTLKQETASPPQANLRAQQRAFERFRDEYNHERPHEALGQRSPASVYQPSSRPCPRRVPVVEYPQTMTVRMVQKRGEIHWRGHRVFVSEALSGEPIGLESIDDRHWMVYFKTMQLATFDSQTLKVVQLARLSKRSGSGKR